MPPCLSSVCTGHNPYIQHAIVILVTEPDLIEQGLLFALWLSQPCWEHGLLTVVEVEASISIFELWCEVGQTGALPLGKY